MPHSLYMLGFDLDEYLVLPPFKDVFQVTSFDEPYLRVNTQRSNELSCIGVKYTIVVSTPSVANVGTRAPPSLPYALGAWRLPGADSTRHPTDPDLHAVAPLYTR